MRVPSWVMRTACGPQLACRHATWVLQYKQMRRTIATTQVSRSCSGMQPRHACACLRGSCAQRAGHNWHATMQRGFCSISRCAAALPQRKCHAFAAAYSRATHAHTIAGHDHECSLVRHQVHSFHCANPCVSGRELKLMQANCTVCASHSACSVYFLRVGRKDTFGSCPTGSHMPVCLRLRML
jgi:hypothetical protein